MATPVSKSEVIPTGISLAIKEAITRVLPTEWRGNDGFTTHLPYEVVGERGPLRLLRFAPKEEHKTELSKDCDELEERDPILFVYSLINRYYILDFMPGRSLLEYFTELGRPCYVIDWGVPSEADRYKTWGDYSLRYLDFAAKLMVAREMKGTALTCRERAWDEIIRRPARPINLFGYCVGGTLSMTFAALRPDRVKTLTLMATPVDFHDEGLLSQWTAPERFDVDRIVSAFGHVPTWLLEGGFRMISPLSNLTKWRDLWDGRHRAEFIEMWRRMEQWASDNVPFPAEVYRQYIRDTYQTNAFFRGEMLIDGEALQISDITCPVLSLIASRDNIVPPKSARAIEMLIPANQLTIIDCDTGHLGLSTSGKARGLFWPAIETWLIENEHSSLD